MVPSFTLIVYTKEAHGSSASAVVQVYVQASPANKFGYVFAVTGSWEVHIGSSATGKIFKVTVAVLLSQ